MEGRGRRVEGEKDEWRRVDCCKKVGVKGGGRRRIPLRFLLTPWRHADGGSDSSCTAPQIIYSSASLRENYKAA